MHYSIRIHSGILRYPDKVMANFGLSGWAASANFEHWISMRICSLISAFVVRCLDSIIHVLLAIAESSRPKLVSVAEQAGLSFNWSQTPRTRFLLTSLIYEPLHDKNDLCAQQRLRSAWASAL